MTVSPDLGCAVEHSDQLTLTHYLACAVGENLVLDLRGPGWLGPWSLRPCMSLRGRQPAARAPARKA